MELYSVLLTQKRDLEKLVSRKVDFVRGIVEMIILG